MGSDGRWGRVAIALVLILAVVFRIAGLSGKVYWGDEVFSSFRVAGFTLPEVAEVLADGQPRTPAELQYFQTPNPDRTTADTVRALAIDDPQHPPLYFVALRWWHQILGPVFGDGPPLRRLLSVLIGLAVLPCAYGLAWELFGSRAIAWTAVAIVGLSPFHVLYSLEVRNYGLWTLEVVGSSWLLFRALRLRNSQAWFVYGLSATSLLYTLLFGLFTLIGHGAFIGIAAIQRQLRRSQLIGFVCAIALALFLWQPWLRIVILGFGTINQTNGFTTIPVEPAMLIQNWGLNLGRLFIDWDGQGQIFPPGWFLAPGLVIGAIATTAALTITAAVDLKRWQKSQTGIPSLALWFLLTLIFAQFLPLLLLDIRSGGFRSGVTRYWVPCYLGLQLLIAFYLGRRQFWVQQQNWGRSLLGLILASQIVSCTASAIAPTWWVEQGSYDHPAVAEILNATLAPGDPSPLILSQAYIPRLISLSYQLRPDAQIAIRPNGNLDNISGDRPVYLYRPSPEWLARIQQQYPAGAIAQPIYQSPPQFP
ncbi:MAG: glycosyltransferase family 39 protein, partial [Cyanobacteria bacterium P01_F01_bin.153]